MKKHYSMSSKKIVAEFLAGNNPGNIAVGVWQQHHPTRKDDSEFYTDPVSVVHMVLTVLREEIRKGQKAQKELKKLKPPTAAEVNKRYYKWLRTKRSN